MRNRIITLLSQNQIQIFSLGSSLVRAASRLVLILLASHFLSMDSFGIFNIFIATYFFTRIISDGSLQMPYVKLASEDKNDRALINTHIAVFKVIYILILSALIYAGSSSIAEFAGIADKRILYFLPGLLLSFGFYSFFCQHLTAALKMQELFVLECILFIVMGVVIAFYYFTAQLVQVENHIMIFILSFGLSGIAAIFLYGKDISWKWVYSPKLAGRIFYYSRYSMVLAMGAMLFLKSDVIMLGHFLTPADVAVYGIALIVSEIINVILDAIQKVCLPTSSLLNSQGKKFHIMDLFNKSMRNAYILSLPLVVFIVIVSPVFLTHFYKGKYDDAFWVIVLLAVSALIKPAGYVAGSVLLGAGYVKVDNKNCWVTAVLNIILNLVFIPLWGILGAALATIISYTALSLLQYSAVKRLFTTA